MKLIFRLILLLVLCLAIAFGTYNLATGMMDRVYNYRSPLAENPPVPGLSLGAPMARQVVFVLVDGLRYDTFLKSEIMPTLSMLRSSGAYARMHSRTPSYSTPGYGVLLTGAWPEISDASAFNLAYEDIRQITQETLYSSAHRLGLKTGISALHWFEKLLPQDAVDVSFYTAGEDELADREVVSAALPWLKSGSYNFILIHLDQVDHAGHYQGGPASPDWNGAATRADALIGDILANMDLEQDVIFVASDHGHIDRGGHGGQEEILMIEPFLLAGKGIRQGDYGDVQMVDAAPTLAAILGLNIPASSQGRVLTEMLSGLPAESAANLPIQTARQQNQLLEKYASAIGARLNANDTAIDAQKPVSEYQAVLEKMRQRKLTGERVLRIVIAVVVLLVIGFVLLRWRLFNAGWIFLGALFYTVIFHLYYLFLGSGLYSFSIVASQMDLILRNGVAAVVVFALVWFLFTWRNRRRVSRVDLATFSALLALITIAITYLPVGLHWVWNGLFARWSLPDIGLLYLALLSMVQVLFLGISGLILSGLSFWIGRRGVGERV